MRKHMLKLSFIISFILLFSACSRNGYESQKPIDANTVYKEAVSEMKKESYKEAVKKFESIQTEQPSFPLSEDIQIFKIYSEYMNGEFALSMLESDKFLSMYPSHKYADYAQYMKAMSYYTQIVDVSRDQEMTEESIKNFEILLSHYPNSRYSKDARSRIRYAKELLVGKKMEIAFTYLKRGNRVAALARYIEVIKYNQNSVFIEEALYRATAIYYSFGLYAEAKKYASLLGYNYPKSFWYKMAYDVVMPNSKLN